MIVVSCERSDLMQIEYDKLSHEANKGQMSVYFTGRLVGRYRLFVMH